MRRVEWALDRFVEDVECLDMAGGRLDVTVDLIDIAWGELLGSILIVTLEFVESNVDIDGSSLNISIQQSEVMIAQFEDQHRSQAANMGR
jgi:hypothetical protein